MAAQARSRRAARHTCVAAHIAQLRGDAAGEGYLDFFCLETIVRFAGFSPWSNKALRLVINFKHETNLIEVDANVCALHINCAAFFSDLSK